MDGVQIALIVVAIVCAVLGGVVKHFVNVIRQSGELLTKIADALEDRKLSKTELIDIMKEAKDVGDAFAKVMSLIKK